MKQLLLLFLFAAALGLSSCCRYRGIACWDYSQTIPFEVEKKDLKKQPE